MEMKNKVAFVTGGASGLGEATVRKVVALGGKAVIFDLDEARAKKLMEELGETVLFVKGDVTKEADVSAAVEEACAKGGGIHLVVNCAGIAIAQKVLGKKGVHDLESFHKVINVNLCGTFNVIRLAVARMVNNEPNQHGERGVIINTASIAAFEGQIGQAAYSASKGGVVGMTLPLAREFAPYGIRVVTIVPGIFETPMFDQLPEAAKQALGAMVPFPSRLGYPEEYALLVQSIVENPMLNGTYIRLDGAIRMQPK
ncbi:MAG TPA: 3-hydroxyacyl-CoA dehydrogenase [Clostridia bacterium]|nr:3-hydroxyacyl-CoA dehydrogenase [Clostridia bacterium]